MEMVRLVQRKGEAVEGEPRTTRQAAEEKGELSGDRGDGKRARKRDSSFERVNRMNHGGVPRVERTVEWVPRGVSFEPPELCQVRNHPRPMAIPSPSHRALPHRCMTLSFPPPSHYVSLHPSFLICSSLFLPARRPRRRTRRTLASAVTVLWKF